VKPCGTGRLSGVAGYPRPLNVGYMPFVCSASRLSSEAQGLLLQERRSGHGSVFLIPLKVFLTASPHE